MPCMLLFLIDQAKAFRKGSQQLYTASYDRTINLYDLSVMGYVQTLFGHQDCILGLDALRAETAVSVGGRDKTVRFWKIVDETQLVFRGGGRSAVRELLEGGGLADVDDEDRNDGKREVPEKKCVEGSLDCVAMIDESTFLSGGDSGCVHHGKLSDTKLMISDQYACGPRRGRNPYLRKPLPMGLQRRFRKQKVSFVHHVG
jgi:ribosomal RNA-processing protein 9